MSNEEDAARLAEEKSRQQREADLVKNRIEELHEQPIEGNFDADHLTAVHAYIFQDLPQHQPGMMREDTANWTKHRALEARPDRYDVPYVGQNVAAHITDVLDRFGGPETIKGLSQDVAADRLAGLYGDLDHGHGFSEGNSRTLREFTREMASEAGFTLDWVKTGVSEEQRNELYLARDLAVYEREFPDLTEERAMQTNDRREYEAFFTIEKLRAAVGDRTLEAIVAEGLSPDNQREHGVGEEADATRGFHDQAETVDPIAAEALVPAEHAAEAALEFVADIAESGIEFLADSLTSLLGGGTSAPPPMTAKERREARMQAQAERDHELRLAALRDADQSANHEAGFEQVKDRNRGGGQSL